MVKWKGDFLIKITSIIYSLSFVQIKHMFANKLCITSVASKRRVFCCCNTFNLIREKSIRFVKGLNNFFSRLKVHLMHQLVWQEFFALPLKMHLYSYHQSRWSIFNQISSGFRNLRLKLCHFYWFNWKSVSHLKCNPNHQWVKLTISMDQQQMPWPFVAYGHRVTNEKIRCGERIGSYKIAI